jgi:hypothetical protein
MGEAMGVLAQTDWSNVLGVINIIATVMLGVGLFYVGTKTSQIDKITDKAEKAANQVVDVRFAAADEAKKAMEERLEKGDRSFDKLDDRDREIERMLLTREAALKDWINSAVGHCASKDDVAKLNGRLDQIVASMAGRNG